MKKKSPFRNKPNCWLKIQTACNNGPRAVDKTKNEIGKTVTVCLRVLWIIFDLTFRDAYISAIQCIVSVSQRDMIIFGQNLALSVISITV